MERGREREREGEGEGDGVVWAGTETGKIVRFRAISGDLINIISGHTSAVVGLGEGCVCVC